MICRGQVDIMAMTLREVRERKCWGQAELARRVGLSPNTLYRIETGRSRPRPATLRRLAEALQVDPSELVEGRAERVARALAALDAARAFRERTFGDRVFTTTSAELINEGRDERTAELP
jgi:HTH-type transcriptional regulator, competence development regulator